MKLLDIFKPISDDLELVNEELGKIAEELENLPARAVFEYYFKIPGKFLRPSLLLLSAATIDMEKYRLLKPVLIKAATAIELVHNSSLIHDDIVDNEMFRRGQKTLNNAYGNKIAAKAGNALFSRAISILLGELLEKDALNLIQTIRKMSTAEICHLNKNDKGSREEYLELITGKTALLMSTSCMLGASIVTADKGKISALQQFGLNFGMAYQIMDDYIDQDPIAIKHVTPQDAKGYTRAAESILEAFDESVYKMALIDMLEYILSLSHIAEETKIKPLV